MKRKELMALIENTNYHQIRITGNGGSGKSTLAKEINANNKYQLICTDDYLLDGETRAKMFLANGERVTANCVEAYDFTNLIGLLKKLQTVKGAYIVEGIGAHFLSDQFFDFSIYYEVSKETELQRRITRGEKFDTQRQVDNFELRRKQFEERINLNSKKYDYKIYE